MSVTLYALDGCPYCEAVKEALDSHEVSYSVTWVDARFSARNEVKRVSGQRSVPVLVDEGSGAVMATTEGIDSYIERTFA